MMTKHTKTLDDVPPPVDWFLRERDLRAEIERLRAALKDLFLLACASNDIRPDCGQMRAAGNLLGKVAIRSQKQKG